MARSTDKRTAVTVYFNLYWRTKNGVAGISIMQTTKTINEQIAEAASNAHNISAAHFNLLELCGKEQVLVQGERRFTTRRLLNKVYLMDKRLIDRRKTQD